MSFFGVRHPTKKDIFTEYFKGSSVRPTLRFPCCFVCVTERVSNSTRFSSPKNDRTPASQLFHHMRDDGYLVGIFVLSRVFFWFFVYLIIL